jgi:outer membrane biosynthesis protein TonB
MVSEKDLRAAAKELNKVTAVQPPLRVTAPLKDLLKEVKESIDPDDEGYILQPTDKFSKETQAIFDELLGKTPAPAEEEEEEEEPEPQEVAEKIHEKNIASAPVNKGKKAPAPKPKVEEEEEEEPEPEEKPAPKKEKAEKAPKPKKEKGPALTKKSIIIDMTGSARGATIEEMAQAMVELWLAKMGFNTRKEAIQKDPRFKR